MHIGTPLAEPMYVWVIYKTKARTYVHYDLAVFIVKIPFIITQVLFSVAISEYIADS